VVLRQFSTFPSSLLTSSMRDTTSLIAVVVYSFFETLLFHRCTLTQFSSYMPTLTSSCVRATATAALFPAGPLAFLRKLHIAAHLIVRNVERPSLQCLLSDSELRFTQRLCNAPPRERHRSCVIYTSAKHSTLRMRTEHLLLTSYCVSTSGSLCNST
jgi:hypothetical protein